MYDAVSQFRRTWFTSGVVVLSVSGQTSLSESSIKSSENFWTHTGDQLEDSSSPPLNPEDIMKRHAQVSIVLLWFPCFCLRLFLHLLVTGPFRGCLLPHIRRLVLGRLCGSRGLAGHVLVGDAGVRLSSLLALSDERRSFLWRASLVKRPFYALGEVPSQAIVRQCPEV